MHSDATNKKSEYENYAFALSRHKNIVNMMVST